MPGKPNVTGTGSLAKSESYLSAEAPWRRRKLHALQSVVIVGAGNAALCAAISAAEHGAEVLVLERAPIQKRGGNSWFTDGAIRFAHNGLPDIRSLVPEMTDDEAERIDLPPYSVRSFLADMQRVSGGRTDAELSEMLAGSSYATMQWLQKQGVEFSMLFDNQSFLVNGRYRFWGGLTLKIRGIGQGLVGALMARVKALGIRVLYETRATGLERSGDDWLLHIKTEGKDRTVTGKAVVLACGGFEADPRKRVQHLGAEWEECLVRGTEYNTGDGLRMALETGAVRYGDWTGCHAVATDAGAPSLGDFSLPGDIFKKHSYPLGIVVNREGHRFVDEGADFRNYTYARYGRDILHQPGQIAFQIFDSKVSRLLRAEYRGTSCSVISCQTLEDLASQAGIHTAPFLSTIKAFNCAVVDGPFNPEILDGRRTLGLDLPKSNWAQRIDEPPFLAFPVKCGITFTFGGVRVSTHGEVLSQNGTPVRGLFAAGEMVGGLFYDNYPGGAGLMSGATFGRISGAGAALAAKDGTES